MNNIIVINQCELFIYFDDGYSGFFHDVKILQEFDLYKKNVNFLCI